MNLPDSEDVQLTEQNFRNVCRLCLRADEDFINVFDRIDQNPSKQPLAERIYDLYQIKVRILFYFFTGWNPAIKERFFLSSHFSWSKKMDCQPIYAIDACTIRNYFRNFAMKCTNVSTSYRILLHRLPAAQMI